MGTSHIQGEDMSERWFEEDPFKMIGHVRIIVVRHNPYYNYKGEKDNCTFIHSVDGLYLGFACHPKDKKYNDYGPIFTYTDDVDQCSHKINHLFKNKPNGIYEMVGEMWCWSSKSWEGEWDGDSEIRNHQIQEIKFDSAMAFGEVGEGLHDGLITLKPIDNSQFNLKYDCDTHISPYMSKQQIYRNHANVLSKLIDNYGIHGRTNFNDSTVEELEACIHMLMLQIDSESRYENIRAAVLEIDKAVKDCLDSHQRDMATES